ncbi:pleiotropic drug resistance protein 3-like [Gossypium australe]|uniref:Pleiotropic drug resistance protein 3-like n=1 Tax=Gossypium australe TaxID=47621 RepID=A0A5B6X051_9ROSI|nr:pleiotropic drug resistance protein 3-like [Gossypium australe]
MSIDDSTRYCWVYFLKQKSKVAEVFWKFKTLDKNQANYKLKMLKSDNRTGYTANKFEKYCKEARIHHQLTNIYTPLINQVCERKNMIVMDMASIWLYLICSCTICEEKQTRKKITVRYLGYNNNNNNNKKGYKIFDPFTSKVIVSRYVKFDESRT